MRPAKRNIIPSLVSGIAATASNAATANVDNNWLATQQEVQYKKELAEAKTISEELRVVAKWEGTSMRQNVLTGTGIAKGFTEGMAGAGLDTLNSAVSFLRDPKESLVAMKEFATSSEAQVQLGKDAAAMLERQLNEIDEALDKGGDENSESLGYKMGQAAAISIGAIASGGSGTASKSLTLSRMGIDISSKKLEEIATTVKLKGLKKEIAELERPPGRDSDVPMIEPETPPRVADVESRKITLPSYYREDSSTGASFNKTGGLPEGYQRVINTRTGNVEVAGPDGTLYLQTADGGLTPKAGGNLAQLVKAEREIAGAKELGRVDPPIPKVDVTNDFMMKQFNDGGVQLKYGDPDGVAGLVVNVDKAGVLGFEIRAAQNHPYYDASGTDMFASAMQRLGNEGIKVNQIRGAWEAGTDSVNTARYLENIANGMSKENAALNTWTGQIAQKYGYGKVEKIETIGGINYVTFKK